jgi:hypothetical protein
MEIPFTRKENSRRMPLQDVHTKVLKLRQTYWAPFSLQSAHRLFSFRRWSERKTFSFFSAALRAADADMTLLRSLLLCSPTSLYPRSLLCRLSPFLVTLE